MNVIPGIPAPVRVACRLAAALVLGSLAACGDAPQDDLRAWMSDAARDLKPNLKPLPAIQQPEIVSYQGEGLTDPFRPAQLDPDRKSSGLVPDANRRREPLEAYPLESLKMVGAIMRGNQSHAIVSADRTLHQVRVGNYLGQNYGQVTRISETEVTLRELVEDTSGEWVERISTLQLQEQAPQVAKK